MKHTAPKTIEELLKLLEEAQENGRRVEIINGQTGDNGPGAMDGLMKALRRKMAGGEGNLKVDVVEEECDECGEVHGPESLDGPPTPATAELASKLLDIVHAHQSPPVFKPAQFVRYRADVQYVKRHRDLHVVLENVDPPKILPMDTENCGGPFVYRKLDVLLANFTKFGAVRTAVRTYADSRELEIYPGVESLLGKHS